MNKKILITGGSGLVGTQLSQLLTEAGSEVVHLGRKPIGNEPYKTYQWDLQKGTIDKNAFDGITHIIHLAGASVADGRWAEDRKKVILSSRVDSTKLLFDYIEKLDVKLESYVSASAIGIYGNTLEKMVDEKDPIGEGFLAEVVRQWEEAANVFSVRTKVAKVRIGVVLSDQGGALMEITKPIRYYVGAPLGSGKQYMSWIHIQDLASIFKHVIDKNLEGAYNAVAPHPVTNREMTQVISKALSKPLFLPNVPSLVLKILLGEMASIVLEGSNVSSAKISSEGFIFRFSNVEKAVSDLLG